MGMSLHKLLAKRGLLTRLDNSTGASDVGCECEDYCPLKNLMAAQLLRRFVVDTVNEQDRPATATFSRG
jgi:hypothetical protein